MLNNNELLEKVRKRVVRKHGNLLLSIDGQNYNHVTEVIRQEAREVINKADPKTEDMIVAHLVGLGPVDSLMRDPEISEIMINKPDDIRIERNGQIEKTNLAYTSAEEVLNVLYRIVQRCGRKVNFSSPLVDARLPDGSRVNAVIPPSSIYPVITIRRFVRKVFTTDELVKTNFLSEEMVKFLEAIILGKANIVVCGATGCGKTTLLRWLADFIPEVERLITIEDIRELNLDHEHCISLEVSDKAGVHELMVNALRMRPDRILLGEVRGAEAFELLQAMGTGHEGSITTVHANYGKMEAVNRLARAMVKAGGVKKDELVSMISETIDFLVFVKRFPDGTRRLVHISQVLSKQGQPVFNDIYRYHKAQNKHEFISPITPELAERIQENLPGSIPSLTAFGGGKVA